MEELKCVIERITFQNPDNGFSVLKASVGNTKELVPLVGLMIEAKIGSCVSVQGEWKVDKRFGRQFAVTSWKEELPTDLYGLKKFLGGGLSKGVGPRLADRIVSYFGMDTISVIENTPERLKEVYNVGAKRIGLIHESWVENREISNIMAFLQGHDISLAYATKIFKRYGMDSIKLIQENPYRLCKDIWGIGFLLADRLAYSLGFEDSHPFRCKSGLLYTLSVLSEAGDVYCPEGKLIMKASELLNVDSFFVEKALREAVRTSALIQEEDMVYLPDLHWAEVHVASRLQSLAAQTHGSPISDAEAYQVGTSLGIEYDALQVKALKVASYAGVMVLTGGPGTGKTTTVQGILRILDNAKKHVLLAAPTGRAAKRMTETTGHDAMTIHRLLEYSPIEGCKRDETNPLTADVLIVDECSMIDIKLMNSLLDAVPDSMSVLLVGDVDQLPSVGPGNVLHDIIESRICPVVRLEHIFRQAAESNIIVNAHRVNHGEMILVNNKMGSDFFFIKKDGVDPGDVAKELVGLVKKRLPEKFGVSPFDIQVLSPMRKGASGTQALNLLLQEALNPGQGGINRNGIVYRNGDKVMQLRNNYDKEVFNGDIGFISMVDEQMKVITVDFDGRDVEYDYSELDELTHAYATTIHKSQGSEYPVVVIPILNCHYIMLQRNLLYTGITRAKKLFVLVGDMQALSRAIRNHQASKRYSYLVARLQNTSLAMGKTA